MSSIFNKNKFRSKLCFNNINDKTCAYNKLCCVK